MIGKILKLIREAKGMTREEVAYQLQTDVDTISSLEKDEIGISMQAFIEIACVYEIAASRILLFLEVFEEEKLTEEEIKMSISVYIAEENNPDLFEKPLARVMS